MMRNMLILMILSMPIYANEAKSCPATKITILDKSEWVKRDQNCLERATKRCIVHYANLPCLIRFEKVEEGTYHAFCGEPR